MTRAEIEKFFNGAFSPAELIFNLKANLLTVKEQIKAAHGAHRRYIDG